MDSHKIIDILFDEIDSTQTHAKEQYQNLYQGQITIIRALHQTAGRGQYNRKWESESKKNIMTTIIYPYFKNFKYLRNVTLVIGYSIIQLYNELYNLEAQLKWVNDIQINGKKAGGILTESESQGNELVLFIGIGLNVNWNIEGATCLEEALKQEIDLELLFKKLKEKVIHNLQLLDQNGFSEFQDGINKVLFKQNNDQDKLQYYVDQQGELVVSKTQI